MNNKFIDKLAWIYIKDRKVLGARSKGKIPYYIPGGKRETDESDEQALMREVTEELGIQLIPESIKHYGTFEAQAHGKPDGMMVRMICYVAQFNGQIKPMAEVEELGWLTYSDRDTEKCSPVDKLILDDLRAKALID